MYIFILAGCKKDCAILVYNIFDSVQDSMYVHSFPSLGSFSDCYISEQLSQVYIDFLLLNYYYFKCWKIARCRHKTPYMKCSNITSFCQKLYVLCLKNIEVHIILLGKINPQFFF